MTSHSRRIMEIKSSNIIKDLIRMKRYRKLRERGGRGGAKAIREGTGKGKRRKEKKRRKWLGKG